MALGLLAAMFAGKSIKNSMDQRQRDQLQDAVNQQFGFGGAAPVPGIPGAQAGMQLNPDGSIGAQRGQSGLFPSTPQEIFQGGSQLFSAPGGAALGQSLMQQALRFQQQNQNQQQQFGQQDLSQENQQNWAAGQNDINRSATLESQRLDRDQRNSIAANRLSAANAPAPFGGLVAPSGFTVNTDPVTGEHYLSAAEGSPAYIEADTNLKAAETSIIEIDKLLTMLDESGPEAFGAQSASMGVMYQNIVSGMAALQKMGVLQKEERENIESNLPNPSAMLANATFDDTFKAAYTTLQSLYQNKLKEANRIYRRWGLGSSMSNTTPAEARELDRQTNAAALAQTTGIVLDAEPVERTINRRGPAEPEAFGGLFPQSSRAPNTNFGMGP